MLIEILTFFAVASALATLVCLAKGVPSWPWPAGVPAALVVLAASGLATALISGDPFAGKVLGVAGLVIWAATWLWLRRWPPLAALMFSMLITAALSYIVYACALTAVQISGPTFLIASSLLLLLVADEELSYEQIGVLVGQSTDAVRGKLHRARKTFAALFNQTA